MPTFVTESSHELLVTIYNAITANGIHDLLKVCTTTYWFQNAANRGFFTATHRVALGSLEQLRTAVEKAGYVVRSTEQNAYSVTVTFDVPEGD